MDHDDSLKQTLELFRRGNSISEIAYKRKLAFSTIETHIAKLVARKIIMVEELIPIERIELIKKAIPNNETTLTFIKNSLPTNISFGEIKWVLASVGKLKEVQEKPQIMKAINVYRANDCFRKCFNHRGIIKDCGKKFEELSKNLGKTEISIKEFYFLMNNGELKICKLSEKKRRAIVTWKKFEEMNAKGKDFWDED
ncbi:MAG: helix-turn-helix domain-containing protein [archaeon]|nr:helix-turn-helix domain-containing protein [archaeon]